MKSTGVIRKIDELGRIVLPKEIRDNLNIQSGDSLEIYINENKIILEKHQYLTSKQKLFDLVNNLKSIIDIKIYITDTDKIITKGILENKPLDNNLAKILKERKIIIKNEIENHYNLLGYYAYYPIIKNCDLLGLIILYKESKLNNEDKLFGKILQSIMTSY